MCVRRAEVNLSRAHGVIVVHGASEFGPINFRVRGLLKAFCQFDTAGTRYADRMIDSPSLFQLRQPDTVL